MANRTSFDEIKIGIMHDGHLGCCSSHILRYFRELYWILWPYKPINRLLKSVFMSNRTSFWQNQNRQYAGRPSWIFLSWVWRHFRCKSRGTTVTNGDFQYVNMQVWKYISHQFSRLPIVFWFKSLYGHGCDVISAITQVAQPWHTGTFSMLFSMVESICSTTFHFSPNVFDLSPYMAMAMTSFLL